MYTVYIIQSESSGRYYVGVTSEIHQRLRHHNSGANVSTKKRGPWKLIYSEQYEESSAAWTRERQIKSYKGGRAFHKLISGEVA